jgi:hypothetical protein
MPFLLYPLFALTGLGGGWFMANQTATDVIEASQAKVPEVQVVSNGTTSTAASSATSNNLLLIVIVLVAAWYFFIKGKK